MGVAVLHPRDSLNDIFSRNNLSPPNHQKKPLPNRRRRHQAATSPHPVSGFVPNGSKKKNLNHTSNIVSSQVRILKRGDDIGKKIPDLVVEKPDLKSTSQIGSDPVKISTPIGIPGRKSMPASFYAGPATSTSPPPSEVPLPAFFAKKNVSATTDLIRILRIDIALFRSHFI